MNILIDLGRKIRRYRILALMVVRGVGDYIRADAFGKSSYVILLNSIWKVKK